MKERVDIIVLKYKLPELEKRCINSIIDNTDYPYQITVYDARYEDSNMSRMWNKLIKESTCNYICIIDSDCEVNKGWLEELMKCINSDVAVVVPRTENVGTPQQINTESGIHELEMASLNCALFSKEVFDTVGFFDEDFKIFGQDSEWFRRVLKYKLKIILNADVFVKHIGGASTKLAAEEGEYNLDEELKLAKRLFEEKI